MQNDHVTKHPANRDEFIEACRNAKPGDCVRVPDGMTFKQAKLIADFQRPPGVRAASRYDVMTDADLLTFHGEAQHIPRVDEVPLACEKGGDLPSFHGMPFTHEEAAAATEEALTYQGVPVHFDVPTDHGGVNFLGSTQVVTLPELQERYPSVGVRSDVVVPTTTGKLLGRVLGDRAVRQVHNLLTEVEAMATRKFTAEDSIVDIVEQSRPVFEAAATLQAMLAGDGSPGSDQRPQSMEVVSDEALHARALAENMARETRVEKQIAAEIAKLPDITQAEAAEYNDREALKREEVLHAYEEGHAAGKTVQAVLDGQLEDQLASMTGSRDLWHDEALAERDAAAAARGDLSSARRSLRMMIGLALLGWGAFGAVLLGLYTG